jgi:hypothetical protein
MIIFEMQCYRNDVYKPHWRLLLGSIIVSRLLLSGLLFRDGLLDLNICNVYTQLQTILGKPSTFMNTAATGLDISLQIMAVLSKILIPVCSEAQAST